MCLLKKSFLFAFRTLLCLAILPLFTSDNFQCFSLLIPPNFLFDFLYHCVDYTELRVQSRVTVDVIKSLPAISVERKFFKQSHCSQFIGGETWEAVSNTAIFRGMSCTHYRHITYYKLYLYATRFESIINLRVQIQSKLNN